MSRAIAILLTAAGLAAALAPGAAALPAGSTTLIDRPTGFGALPHDGRGLTRVQRHSLSFNACFVVYESRADDLLPGDDNSATNVYRQNRCTPGVPVQQVNTTATGEPAQALSASTRPTISADGRYVAFGTTAQNLHPAVGPDGQQVLVKDMQTGALVLASRANGPNGAPAEPAGDGVISGNGSAVAFRSHGPFDASNVDGQPNTTSLYIRNLTNDSTRMVSMTGNNAAGGATDEFDVSFGGDYVAFVSGERLLAADDDSGGDVYLRRLIGTGGEETRLVSFATGQTAGADGGYEVAISGNAGLVAYANEHMWLAKCPVACNAASRMDQPGTGGSNAEIDVEPYFAQTNGAEPIRVYWTTRSPLNAQDVNGVNDIYGAPINGGPATLVTNAHLVSDAQSGDSTDNASVAVFTSASSNLPAGGEAAQAYDLAGGQLRNLAGVAGLPVRANETSQVDIPRLHALSDDGRVVAFSSAAAALGAPPKPGAGRVRQVFVRDLESGQTTLVSANDAGEPQNASAQSGQGVHGEVSIDAAGEKVAFLSAATNLVNGATNGIQHVYARDLRGGALRLVDRAPDGSPSQQGGFEVRISGDGRKVGFLSASPDLPGGNGSDYHAYVADLDTGVVDLVDRAADSSPANSSAGELDLSHDGTRIAFASAATNLGGPPGTGVHIYLRDLRARTTTFASAPSTPQADNQDAPSLSGDGTRLAFFEYGPTHQAVAVRDLTAGATTAAATAAGSPSLSRDGASVAFTTDGGAYVRHLAEPAATRVDVRDGGSSPGRFEAVSVSLAGSGGCAVFTSNSDDLVSPGYGPDLVHAFLRTFRDGCAPAPGSSAGPTPATGDTTPPVIGRARVTPKRFAVGSRRTPRSAARRKKRKGGTTFVFTLSEAARTRIAIERALPGRRAKRGRRCVKPRRGLKRRCTRYAQVLALTRSRTRQGANRVAFSGRVGRRKLKPGAYRATLVATDAAGIRSRPRRLIFRVVRP